MSITHINIVYWLLAIAGAAIHIFLKLSEVPESQRLRDSFKRKDVFVAISSFIAIPVLLLLMTDTAFGKILPLNYVTAFLTGYQTQSFLRSMVVIASKRYLKEAPVAAPDDGQA